MKEEGGNNGAEKFPDTLSKYSELYNKPVHTLAMKKKEGQNMGNEKNVEVKTEL